MRIVPLILITIGSFGLLRYFGIIDAGFLRVFWPLLLIGIGVYLLWRGPRWRADFGGGLHDRWERRMHRRFGPGWASLTEEERERFRAGMRQWRAQPPGGSAGPAGAPGSPVAPQPPAAPGEPR